MIYRLPVFLAEVCFGSSPTPSSPVSKLDRRHTGRLKKRKNLLSDRGKGMGEEPNQTTARSMVLSSVNYLILSVFREGGGDVGGSWKSGPGHSEHTHINACSVLTRRKQSINQIFIFILTLHSTVLRRVKVF